MKRELYFVAQTDYGTVARIFMWKSKKSLSEQMSDFVSYICRRFGYGIIHRSINEAQLAKDNYGCEEYASVYLAISRPRTLDYILQA